MKQRLTQSYLKECLTYDPDTGIFVWNTRPLSHFKNSHGMNTFNAQLANKETVYKGNRGYFMISLNKRLYLAHRLAFLYMEGYFPENDVDHIDRDKSNNKWSNLREVSTQCNMQNCNLSKANKSGVCGVYWSRWDNKWIATIRVAGKAIYLGRFVNFEDAVMARYQEEVNNPLWTCSVESTSYKYLKERNLI